MAKKRKITNETAKKKVKELLVKYNGDIEKVKEELINKYEFDYKTVIKEVVNELKGEQKSKAKKTKQTSEKTTTKSKSAKNKTQPFTGFDLPNYQTPEPPEKDPRFVRKISDEEAFKQFSKLKSDPQALLNFLKQHDFPSKKAWLDVIKKNPQGVIELGEEDPSKGIGGRGKIKLDLEKATDVYKELLKKHNGDFDKALNELYRDYDLKDKKAFEVLINQAKAKYEQRKSVNRQLPQGEEYPLAKVQQPETGGIKTETPPPTEEVKTETPTSNAIAKAETQSAEAVKEKGFFSKIGEGIGRNKGKLAVLTTLFGLGAYAVKNRHKQQEEQQVVQAPQEQPQGQAQQGQQSQQIPLPTTSQSPYSEQIKEVQQNFLQLAEKLDKYRQVYDEAMTKYTQANEMYEKQLLEILPSVSLLLAKTPLNNMTQEDLIHHTNQLFTMMPYEDALSRVGSLTKGYYIAKFNGVDPSSLSTTDLLEIAENPVFAKSTDENLAQLLSQTGEILKLKMKNNLDKIGALKDMYGNIVKELHEQANIYKDILSSIKEAMWYDIMKEKTDISWILGNKRIAVEEMKAENRQNNKDDIRAIVGDIKQSLNLSPETIQQYRQIDKNKFSNIPPLVDVVGANKQ
jgi:hypothetical protein